MDEAGGEDIGSRKGMEEGVEVALSYETDHHRNKGTVAPNSQRPMSGTLKGKRI